MSRCTAGHTEEGSLCRGRHTEWSVWKTQEHSLFFLISILGKHEKKKQATVYSSPLSPLRATSDVRLSDRGLHSTQAAFILKGCSIQSKRPYIFILLNAATQPSVFWFLVADLLSCCLSCLLQIRRQAMVHIYRNV